MHHPEHYTALRDHEVPFVYDNDGYWYYRTHRTVEEAPRPGPLKASTSPPSSPSHSPSPADPIHFHAVNYSPPFQAAFPPTSPPESQTALFAALAAFERLLARPEGMYEFTMQQGDMVVFDNRRVLHARRAFRNKPPPCPSAAAGEEGSAEPTRWLKGCYMDGDVVWNKLRVLNRLVRTGEVEPLPEWKEVLKEQGLVPRS